MSRKANPTLIGSVVLGGVVIAVIAVVVLGSGRLFRDTGTFISFFDASVVGLQTGSPVRFRGIPIGQVTEILIDIQGTDRERGDARIAVVYEVDRGLLEARGAGVRLADPMNLDTMMALGIRAQLATESLVTGLKYIGLDLDPTAPPPSPPVEGLPYPEIPTVSTGFEALEEEIYGMISELGAVKLDTLVTTATDAFSQFGSLASKPELATTLEALPATIESLNTTIRDVQVLMASIDSALVPMRDGVLTTASQATSTMESLQVRIERVSAVLEPNSPLLIQFEEAMAELSAAGRAMRNLADYLERNPSALIRGRAGGDR
jgi:paraquat-inducible protein B